MELLGEFLAASMPKGGNPIELYSNLLSITSQMKSIYRNDAAIQFVKHQLMKMRFCLHFLPKTKPGSVCCK